MADPPADHDDASRVDPAPMLRRPRLLHALGRRFEVDLVALVAGAGFGKSTLLAQAIAENDLAPRGVDRWMRCTRRHRDPVTFVGAVAAAFGVDPGPAGEPAADLDRVLDAAARRWPLGVCLIIDDVHEVAGAEPDDLLHQLSVERPAPIHLVVASRTAPAWLRAARRSGRVLELGEHELRLDDDEHAALAALRRSPVPPSEHFGGWPALVDLAMTFGVGGVDDFVEDEIFDRIDPGLRRVLALASTVGGGRHEIVAAAVGERVDLGALAAQLPLVECTDGVLVVHQLWDRFLAGELGADERRAAHSRVARVHEERHDDIQAARSHADAEDWDGFERAVCSACRRGYIAPGRDLLDDWIARLPADRHGTPLDRLLRGASARVRDSFGDRGRDHLQAAMDGYRAAGFVLGELAAMSEYAYVVRARGEIDRLVPVMVRLVELDDAGQPDAGAFARFARAAIAELTGDDDGLRRELAPLRAGDVSSEWLAAAGYLRLFAAGRLGDPDEFRAAAAVCAEHGAGSIVGRHAETIARWYVGEPLPDDRIPLVGIDPRLTTVEIFGISVQGAMFDAHDGRLEDARAHLRTARTALPEVARPDLAAALAVAEATILVCEGDEAAAAATLRTQFAGHDRITDVGTGIAPGHPALFHVLLPEWRDRLAATPLGPLGRRGLDVGRAVVGARGDGPPVPSASWPSPDQILAAVPVPWAVELAAAADDASIGTALMERLVVRAGDSARRRLRALADSGGPASGARALLGRVVVEPADMIVLHVLGPSRLLVGGVAVDRPGWGRDLVRTLLALLALRGPLDRDAIGTLLWPSQPPETAARNLRPLLTHVHRLLEPTRRAGEASFFIRVEGDRIALAGPPFFDTDVRRFDADLARARAAPDGRLAVDAFDAALARWRGAPLADVAELPWVDEERARMRALFADAGVEAGRTCLSVGEPLRAITFALDVLAVDPLAEAAHQVLVAGHLAADQRAAALRAMARCRAVLADLGLAPSPATLQLVRRLEQPD